MGGLLTANEVMDDARRLKKELLLFIVNLEKAFDSVDWKYFETVMEKMNIPTLWRKLIMECVTTTAASVLVNGSPTNEFKFERWIRQGDSLSPFLYLLDVEGINVMMNATMKVGLFTRYRVGRSDNISVSHLQFVDDTLFMGGKRENTRSMKVVLIIF